MLGPVSHPLKNALLGVGRPGRLRWRGPWFRGMPFGWREALQEMPPLKIRWGWVLLLAIALVLAMGELGPAASVLIALP